MKGVRLKALGLALMGALTVFLASCGQQPPAGGGGGSQTGTLEVTVVDQNNNPVQGATVILTNTNSSLGTTNSQGKVTATLAPGTYGVKASKPGYQDDTNTATVVAGQTATLRLTLTAQPSQPGFGVCRPSGDGVGLFTATVTPDNPSAGDNMLSIQTTNGSGEHCFVKGKVRFSAQASGASLVQLFLSTSQNAQAGQLLASGTTSASYTLDTTTIPQGETRYLIAHVQIGSRVVDQVWTIVPDNLAPQLPDVREINDLNNLNLGRWVKGTKTLTLENTELVDNPTPGLASGIKKVTFYAQRIDRDTGEPDGDPVVIGTAASLPYQVNWNTTAVNDGLYHVYAVAEDLLGNKKDAPPYAGFLVSVDNTAPIVSLTVEDNGTGDVANGSDVYAASEGFVSGAAKVIFSANDSGVGVDPSALGLSYTGGSISLTSTSGTVVVDVNHVSGQVTFTFTARDRLGNERSTSQTVTVDNEAPSISRLYLEGQPTVVNAGSQQILNVRATDGISGLEPTSTYVYAGSNASSSATAPFWNATVTTGGLLGLGVVTGDFLNVLIPDPTNEGPSGGTDPLDLIVIVRDRAGNARIDYLTVQVAHTASSDNEVSGGTLTRNTVSGNTEYTVTGVTTLSGTLYVAFFATNSLGLAGVPVGNAPSYLTPSTPIYDLVQTVETPPYRLVSSNSNLFAAGFNSHGHASTTKIQ